MSAPATLIYNGIAIRDRNEMLNLTDAWKAAGSPAHMEPWNWARKEGAGFIEAVAVAHNLPVEQVIAKKRGKSGATWAHWQAGIAYVKYLNHDFHMWANKAVREKMEGKPQAGALLLDEASRSVIGGIVKSCTGVVVREYLDELLPAMIEHEVLKRGLHVGRSYVPAIEVLKDKKVPPRGRRAFSQMVSARLRRLSVTIGKVPILSAETGRYLFHVEVVRVWLEREGNAMIISHIAALKGQGNLFALHPKEGDPK